MKRLILAAALLFATSASATSHTFTGTIDTPPGAVWVDDTGATVAPFAAFQTSMLYVDTTTSYVWSIHDAGKTTPFLTSSYEASASDLGLVYTTTNCTGTAYLIASGSIPYLVRTSGDGQLYVAGDSAAVTGHSRYVSGNCYLDTVSVPLFLAIGPLAPPTIAAGPWHLEVR